MLMVAVVCATGCTKDPDNGGNNNGNNTENGGGNGNGGSNGGGNGSGDNSEDDSTPSPPTDEGMYLGFLGQHSHYAGIDADKILQIVVRNVSVHFLDNVL